MKKGGRKAESNGKKVAKFNHHGQIPYGRDEVKKAILDATEKLLLKKSPNRITVREIAAAANIKHPLIHRHFGTKDEVIIAVHMRGVAEFEKRVAEVENLEGNISTFFEAVKQNKFRRIALARAMIDGVSPRAIQTDFRVMQRLLELVRKKCAENGGDSDFAPEMITAVLASTTLGWFLYKPYLAAAMELEGKSIDELNETIVEILEKIFDELS